MAGTANGMPSAPLSPTSTTTSLFAATRRVQQLEDRFAMFATQTNADGQALTSRVASLEGALRQREEEIKQILEVTAAQRATELAEVVANAKSEFDNQRAQLQNMGRIIEAELREVQQQVGGRQSGDPKQGKGFLPLKELRPPKLAKDEQWREWSDHFSEYADASCSGMKECLRAVAKFESKPDASVIGQSAHAAMATYADSLHMAIKHLTEEGSMARNIVLSAPGEDGFTTWWCLHNTFTRNLTARQGAVMTDFAASHGKPGKNPSETRTKLLEVDTAAKKWEEIMGTISPNRC